MLVCHCNVVTDTQIREVIAAGALDEVAVARACGAGGECGGCRPTVRALLGECAGCPLVSPAARTLFVDEASAVA